MKKDTSYIEKNFHKWLYRTNFENALLEKQQKKRFANVIVCLMQLA